MHNTLNYYKQFKKAINNSVKKQMGIEHEEDKNVIVLKIIPDVVLNMIDDIIELIETTEKGKWYLIGDIFEDVHFYEVPVMNTSKKDVYNAVQKLLELLKKLGIRN